MAQRNNFMGVGATGTVWWTGVVCDRNDPLKLGRVQVRIFGWHTGNKNTVPKKNLPWATASASPGASKTFTSPFVGDWVWGFFMDGESAQFPVYVGVLQGKLSRSQVQASKNAQRRRTVKKANNNNVTVSTSTAGPGEVTDWSYVDGIRYDEHNGFEPAISGYSGEDAENLIPPPGIEISETSYSDLAQGTVTGTTIARANDQLVHVCDITADMRKTIATVTFQISEVIQKIRAAIKALWSSSLASPFADQIRQAKNYIESELKIVQKVIKNARDMSDALVAYARSMKDILDYIATLPEKAAKLLSECLQTATRGIADSINEGKALAASSVVAAASSNAVDLAKKQAAEVTTPTYQLP